MKKTRHNRRRTMRRTRRRGGLFKPAAITNNPTLYCSSKIVEKIGKEPAKVLCEGIFPSGSDVERSRLKASESGEDEDIKLFFENYFKYKKEKNKLETRKALMSYNVTKDIAAAAKAKKEEEEAAKAAAAAAGGRRTSKRNHRKTKSRRSRK